jgi:hypothetical protein
MNVNRNKVVVVVSGSGSFMQGIYDIMYLKQIMFLEYTLLQMFCIYYVYYM